MKRNIKSILFICILFLSVIFSIGCVDREDAVKYEVTFNALWSEETHSDDFPSNPHFSGLIGASHNYMVKFWNEGDISTPGIKNMAETGSKNPLNIEIGNAILNGSAFYLISGSGINPSPGSTSIIFEVSEDYPLVSIVTMIAPSPDWFVGVSSLNLFENNSFIDEKIVTLYAYDAGTDSGINYTSPDEPTNPIVPIFKITGYPFNYSDILIPLGTFVFKKL
jgi:hypothetical protein